MVNEPRKTRSNQTENTEEFKSEDAGSYLKYFTYSTPPWSMNTGKQETST